MTIFQKPWIFASSARTAGRCDPARRRKTPRLYPANKSEGGFTSGFGIIFSSSALRKNFVGPADQKTLPLFVYASAVCKPLSNVLVVRQHRFIKPLHGALFLNRAPRVCHPIKPHTTAHTPKHRLARYPVTVSFSVLRSFPSSGAGGTEASPRRMRTAQAYRYTCSTFGWEKASPQIATDAEWLVSYSYCGGIWPVMLLAISTIILPAKTAFNHSHGKIPSTNFAPQPTKTSFLTLGSKTLHGLIVIKPVLPLYVTANSIQPREKSLFINAYGVKFTKK